MNKFSVVSVEAVKPKKIYFLQNFDTVFVLSDNKNSIWLEHFWWVWHIKVVDSFVCIFMDYF